MKSRNDVDVIELCSAFQSEKTGSTPVGGAIDLKRFCPIFLFQVDAPYPLQFDSRRCFVRFDEVAPLRGGSQPLVSGIRRINCQQTEFIVIVAMVWSSGWSEADKATRGLAGPNRSAGREVARGLLTVRKP